MCSTSSTEGTATSPCRACTAKGEGADPSTPTGPALADIWAVPAHKIADAVPTQAAPTLPQSLGCRRIEAPFYPERAPQPQPPFKAPPGALSSARRAP